MSKNGISPRKPSIVTKLRVGWVWLTYPSKPPPSLARSRQVRLLLSIQVLLLISCAVLTTTALTIFARPDLPFWQDPQARVTLTAGIVLLVAYLLGRRGSYEISAFLTLSVAVVSNFAVAFAVTFEASLPFFYYLLLPILFSSVLINLRATLMLVLAILMVMLFFLLFLSEPSLRQEFIVGPLNFLATLSSLILIIMWQRDLLEKDRLNELKQAQQQLAAEKQRLVVTLESIGDGVITTNRTGRIVLLNPVAQQLTGWNEADAVGRELVEVFQIVSEKGDLPVANPVQQVLETNLVVGLANGTVLLARDGSRRLIADSAAPIHDGDQTIGVALVFRDITEKHRLEEELQKAQRLEGLGLLAGGVAHDFNNILMALAGNLSLVRQDPALPPTCQELLDEAEAAAFRAKSLTRQLLTFAKGGTPLKQAVSLATLLRETVNFTLRGSNVRSLFDLASDLWAAEIDREQISQVVQNLAINAAHAMPNGGILTIRAENLRSSSPLLPLGLRPNQDYILIEVIDHGTGISPENISRIFEPYFTTKSTGSGLGLATSFSIIKRHEGLFQVASELGTGTTFSFYLPANPLSLPKPEIEREKIVPPKNNPVVTKGRRILVLEDEPAIQHLLQRLLTFEGYKVEVAADGSEVIKMYQAALSTPEPFAVVIMDLTIPGGMGGKETIQKLQEFDPAVKAIVASGYSDDEVVSNYRAHGFGGALVKPFRMEELRLAVAEVITTSSPL
ncbi:MAG: ATP-binding protein [Chloroflexota bacterium]